MKKTIIISLLSITLIMFIKLMKLGSLFTMLSVPFTQNATADKPTNMETSTGKSIYDYKMKTLDGKEIDLAQYKGKKVVILNTASACGYTPQYADWQKFHEANKDKVVVLGFPCNDFGSQEKGSSGEIATFCQKNYGVTFQMFEKVKVKGEGKSPLYQYLSDKNLNGWNDKEPSWNFCKYLINEKGEVINFFASGVKPTDSAFLDALKK